MLSAAHLGAELESIQWTFQGKMNSWTFQGQLRLPLKQTLRRGRENERERGESVPVTHCAACVSHSSLWPVSQLLWSLPNSPRKNNPEREKGGGKKTDPAMFFPGLLEMSSELPGRGMRAIPWSRGNDVGATLHGGDMRGRGFCRVLWMDPLIGGPPTQLESCSSVPLTFSPAGLPRERQSALISCVQDTSMHTATCTYLTEILYKSQTPAQMMQRDWNKWTLFDERNLKLFFHET